MDKDELIQRLMATFVAELEDHAHALEGDLLALEKDPTSPERGELFNTLFRTAHSLKGSARSVGSGPIETIGHHLEEFFAAARDGRLAVDAKFFGRLLPAIDALLDAARRLRSGADLAGAPIEQLARSLQKPGDAPATAEKARTQVPPLASAAPLPGAGWTGTVRVPAEKLDALLTQSGELLGIRHRVEARGEEATALEDAVAAWRKDWRRLEAGIALVVRRDGELMPGSTREEAARRVLLRQVEQAAHRSADGLAVLEHGVQHLAAAIRSDRGVIDQTAGALDAEVRRTRMVPFATACEGLERMVRDLIAGSEKQVEVVVEGGEIELDRSVLEGLRDPLIHLVRNAVDHGIGTVATRRAAGKPVTGRVVIGAALRGSRVEITVSDDGKGLDLVAIREQLRKHHLAVPDDERELAQAIFLPGFSTSTEVTQLSGRGVGLDVVKTRLASLRGSTEVAFVPMQGTRFTLYVPLTLTSVRAVMVVAGGQTFAIDAASVHRILRIDPRDVRLIEGREVVLLSDTPIPVVTLSEVLGFTGRSSPTEPAKLPAIVLTNGSRLVAFIVDSLETERDMMVRALGPRLKGVKHVVGATNLPDGRVVFILNATELVAHSAQLSSAKVATSSPTAELRPARKRLLVVDDSATVRALHKSILEAAGYEVRVAVDGADAWSALSQHGADLVVSDVEMPHMDGFQLTETVRSSKRFRDLPVVLVTAKESEADKARGLAVGADAYCVKSTFDQEALLALIEQLL